MNTNLLKTFFVALFLITATRASAHDFYVDGIRYYITSTTAKTVEVTYIGSSYFEYDNEYTGSVVIPSVVTYNNAAYCVTSIGNHAFRGCSGLTGVTIPYGVTSIEGYAFYDCSGLTSVTIPNSVTSIENYAFAGCYALTSVTIPNRVTSIESGTFKGCYALTSVTIPNRVTSIGNYAFYDCSGLTGITIPNSVTSIGSGAFSGCSGLTGVTIPNSVTSIENYAFYGCYGLTSITIPNSVTTIGNSAFAACIGLSRVTIGKNVKTIEDNAFSGCRNLSEVINASSLNIVKGSADNGYVGYYADLLINANDDLLEGDFVFGVIDGKNTLCGYIGNDTEIVLPANYKGGDYIISSKFQGVTKIALPDFVKEIVHRQFYKCVDLNSIVMPDNITSIGAYAFQYCDLLSIHIPATVKEIGDYAFTWNLNLSSITVDKNNPVYYVPDGYKNIIMERATNKIVFACKGAVIPETATAIGNGAFNGVGGIESITIPAGITSIGDWAFDGCRGLVAIYSPSTTPAKVSSSSFTDTSTATLYVPIGAKEAYATAWGFDNIVETDFTCVDGVTADEQTDGNELYYDLSGRAVKNPANGIYIYKGKKVLVQ